MPHELLPLDMLRPGEWADVADVGGDPSWVCRMAEMGLQAGCRVQMLQDGSGPIRILAGIQDDFEIAAATRDDADPITVVTGEFVSQADAGQQHLLDIHVVDPRRNVAESEAVPAKLIVAEPR